MRFITLVAGVALLTAGAARQASAQRARADTATVPVPELKPHRFNGRYRPDYETRPSERLGPTDFEGILVIPPPYYARYGRLPRRVEGGCAEVMLISESGSTFRLETPLPVLGAWSADGLEAAIDLRLGRGQQVVLDSYDRAQLVILPGAFISDLKVRPCREQ